MVTATRYEKAIESVIPRIKPLTYARVTIIDGDQGSGKSMTAIGIVINATFEGMTSVILPDGKEVKAQPVRNKQGFALIGYGKLWIPEPRIIRIPHKSIVKADGIRIIYNGHLFGIYYAHMELIDIIKHLNDGSIKNCYLIIDEAYITGDKREGMSPLVRIMTKLSKQLRKRHVHLVMCTPDSDELDKRFRKIEVEHIVCSYDEDLEQVTEYIRNPKKYKRTRQVTYDGRLYRKYYNTDEIFEIPKIQLDRALVMAGMSNDENN